MTLPISKQFEDILGPSARPSRQKFKLGILKTCAGHLWGYFHKFRIIVDNAKIVR